MLRATAKSSHGLLHFLGMVPLYLIVTRSFGVPFWLYLLIPAYFGLALITIRTYAEHRWTENAGGPHDHRRALSAGPSLPQQ